MTVLKTETLTIRLCPETKAALRHMAEQEHRSLSNMLEIMIRRYRGDRARLIHVEECTESDSRRV